MERTTNLLAFAFALGITLVGCGGPADEDPGDGDDSGSQRGGASGAAGSNAAGSNAAGSSGAGSSNGGTGSGSGGASTGGAGGSGAAAACNSNEANAPDYLFIHVPDPAPTPAGGTIIDGTYFVTSVTWYESPLTGSSNTPGGIRVDIAGDRWNEANASPDGTSESVHFTFDLEIMSPNLVLTQICPNAVAPEQFAYSADDDTLTVFITDAADIFGMLLTRQ
jgi:hypothetical protein